MIAIYPSDELLSEGTTWEVWEAGERVRFGLSPAEAGQVAHQLTIKRAYEAMRRKTEVSFEGKRPPRRGIYWSKDYKGKWEIWEDGKCVDSFDDVAAAAQAFVQKTMGLRP